MDPPDDQPPGASSQEGALGGLLQAVHDTASSLVDAAVKESIESILAMLSLGGDSNAVREGGEGEVQQPGLQPAASKEAPAGDEDSSSIGDLSPTDVLSIIKELARQVVDEVVRAVVNGSVGRVLHRSEIIAVDGLPAHQPIQQPTIAEAPVAAAPSAAARAAVQLPEEVLEMGDTGDLAAAMVESYMIAMLQAGGGGEDKEGGGLQKQQLMAEEPAAAARVDESMPRAAEEGGMVPSSASGHGVEAGVVGQSMGADHPWRLSAMPGGDEEEGHLPSWTGSRPRHVEAVEQQAPPPLRAKQAPPPWASAGRHESLRVRRIRHQLRLPRPAPAAVGPPPRLVIRACHAGHESRRVTRLRRQAKLFKERRRRQKRALLTAARGARQPSRAHHHPSLLVRYLAHMLPIARDAGPEALLHATRLLWATAMDPQVGT